MAVTSRSHRDAANRKVGAGIQVIARAMSILRALQDHPEGLSLGEIAKLLKLPRATVQRIVDSLAHENMVISASPTRGVRLGPALMALASSARFDIVEIARPTLQDIGRACGETVVLSILEGEKLVLIDQLSGGHQLRAESRVGSSLPLHATAPGKAILASLSNEKLNQMKSCLELVPSTSKTITTWSDLERSLLRVRKTGFATDLQEHSIGICAVAASVSLPNGEVAAISIPVPTQRFAEMQAMLQEVVVSQAARLQNMLGKPNP